MLFSLYNLDQNAKKRLDGHDAQYNLGGFPLRLCRNHPDQKNTSPCMTSFFLGSWCWKIVFLIRKNTCNYAIFMI